VLESATLLERQYHTNPLPLPPEKARAATIAENFHLLQGHGYRKAAAELCAPSGSVPFLKGATVLQALERSMWHYARSLALAWRVYRPPAGGAWQGMHRVHRHAAFLKLDRKLVEDRLVNSNVDVYTLYMQTLLLAAVNPYAFAQTEQDTLWPLTRGYAARCGLVEQSPDALAPIVPEDADRGPGPGANDEVHSQWLDLRGFSEDVDRALSRVRDGQADLAPGAGQAVRVGNDLLIRLRRAFGQIAARGLKRLPAGHRLDTVLGLSGVHYFLAGQRDFDTFMRQSAQGTVHVAAGAAWTQGSTGSARLPRYTARVLDQSLGGYRMAWENAEQARARVGELVGLNFGEDGEEQDWMVGVMRWLRYETGGGLSAGVELLSRRGSPVALRVVSADGGSRQVARAVEVFPVDGSDGRCFVSNASIEAGSRVEVIHDATSHLAELGPRSPDVLGAVDVLLNAGDYFLIGERARPAEAGAAA
jgi:cyclic-di-GMP-binding protein